MAAATLQSSMPYPEVPGASGSGFRIWGSGGYEDSFGGFKEEWMLSCVGKDMSFGSQGLEDVVS